MGPSIHPQRSAWASPIRWTGKCSKYGAKSGHYQKLLKNFKPPLLHFTTFYTVIFLCRYIEYVHYCETLDFIAARCLRCFQTTNLFGEILLTWSDCGEMKFRFCGDLDCPDWVLAEISTLSKMVRTNIDCSRKSFVSFFSLIPGFSTSIFTSVFNQIEGTCSPNLDTVSQRFFQLWEGFEACSRQLWWRCRYQSKSKCCFWFAGIGYNLKNIYATVGCNCSDSFYVDQCCEIWCRWEIANIGNSATGSAKGELRCDCKAVQRREGHAEKQICRG